MYKTVILPLYVPSGSYCFYQDENGDRAECQRLVISGGHISCLMDFEPEREEGSFKILKDPECLELETLEE